MNYCRNEKGIALVMALVLALIALAIVSALLFFITQGSSISGIMKRYETANEAAKGGGEIFTKDLVTETLRENLPSRMSDFNGANPNLNMVTSSNNCLYTKLTNPTSLWGACSTAFDPKTTPDITFTLSGPNSSSSDRSKDFNVFIKVVDTVGGNTDLSGLDLEGFGVVEGGGLITPAPEPYMYRIEIQAEQNPTKGAITRTGTTANERSNLSVLYAY